MRIKSKLNVIWTTILIFVIFFAIIGCRNEAGFINPYDLVAAANSFDKTELMQEMQLSLTSLGQVIIPTEEQTGQ